MSTVSALIRIFVRRSGNPAVLRRRDGTDPYPESSCSHQLDFSPKPEEIWPDERVSKHLCARAAFSLGTNICCGSDRHLARPRKSREGSRVERTLRAGNHLVGSRFSITRPWANGCIYTGFWQGKQCFLSYKYKYTQGS